MAIHYRSFFKGAPSPYVFRSLKQARKNRIDPDAEPVSAFPSRAVALANDNPLSDYRLLVRDDEPAPEILDAAAVRRFLAAHDYMRQQPGKFRNISKSWRASLMQSCRNRLFGFGPGGEAIHAQQSIEVSRQYIYYRCPIYVNGTKTTRNTLAALFPEITA